MRPYYADEYTTLYHGDWRTVLDAVTLPTVDLVLTDPPYGIGWETDYTDLSLPASTQLSAQRQAWPPITGDQEPFDPSPWLRYPKVILWGAHCYSDRLPQGRWLVWDKRFPSGKSFLGNDAETAWMKGGHGVRLYAQTWQGICRQRLHVTERGPKGGHPSLHPTMKPVSLMAWCIGLAGRRVQTVLDPYAGSCSTLVAAKARGLRCIGIEIEEQYCATGARRLAQTAVEAA